MSEQGPLGLSADQLELLEALMASEGIEEAEESSIPRRPDPEHRPLSFAQRRLWFLAQLDPQAPNYNVPGAVHLRGTVDEAALDASLREILRRHEILRTAFTAVGGQPAQVLAPPPAHPMAVVDLTGLAAGERWKAAEELARREAQRPFDLSASPLLRAALLRLGADGAGRQERLLLLDMHHIVSDGWSMGILIREMARLYQHFSAGPQAPGPRTQDRAGGGPLPELPIQYADFAAWQERWLAGGALEEQLAYWRRELAGYPTVLELPTDHPRPAVQTFRGAGHSFALSPDLSAALLSFAKERGLSPFMLHLAAFGALLARYSGQRRLLVGSPIAGRNRGEIEGLIGFFVNTLVLPLDLTGDPPAGRLLERVRQATVGAYDHQDLPFERLVAELSPERDRSRTPLFQVLFVFQNAPVEELSLPGLQVEAVALDSGTAKFDLSLSMAATGGRLSGSFEYATDLFDPATMRRMAGHFRRLLEAVVAGPGVASEVPVGALPLMAPGERWQLLGEWNEAAARRPEAACLHRLVAAQVERTPEAAALVREQERLSYGELARRWRRLAGALVRWGVGPEVPVGVCLPRRPEMVTALLAVLEAGGLYVPLDPAYPESRLALIIEDAAAPLVLTRRELAGRLPAAEAGGGEAPRRVYLDEEVEEAAGAGDGGGRCPAGADPSNLAYLIYTSGSTGRPKGVAIEHRSAAALVAWAHGLYRAGELAGVLAATSICFDLSIYELFVPLSRGGRVILAENALELPSLAAAGEVTLINTVPSAMTELVALEGVPPSVTTVNLAGEPLQRRLVEAIYDTTGVRAVYDLYGPSEDTTYSTGARVDPGEGPVAIGGPVTGSRAYAVDDRLRPVPLGVPGELLLGGAGLARGYLRRPAATAERFIPDPLSGGAGERLYRTGDLVRHRTGGGFLFLGRRDHQVKVRGFRIELGEIEAVLSRHPAVAEVAVLALGESGGDRRLVAFVGGEPPADPGELRRLAGEDLPAYMVPGSFVLLAALPLSPNGKVDRKALARLGVAARPAAGSREGGYVPPRSPDEEVLAGIWSELLGVERVGAHDHFFELGGHSLLATQVFSRVRDLLGVELPLGKLFETPTLADLAREVESARLARSRPAPPPIQAAPRGGDLPLSFAQQRLWLLHRLAPASPAYNMPAALAVRGRLDGAALEASLRQVVRRHETLRTTFSEVEGEPRQVIAVAAAMVLPRVDLKALGDGDRRREARRLAAGEARRPFDLERGPLLRATLVVCAPEEHLLLLDMHHIVSDGWSMGVLVRELGSLYRAFARGERASLPELPVQYADFALWQRRWLEGEVLDQQMEYWRRQLAGAPGHLELPADHPRPPAPSGRGESFSFTLPAAVRDGLEALGHSAGCTLFMTLLAAFDTLLLRYTGEEDLLVGSPVAGRGRSEVEGLIGFFVNTLVLRGDLSGDPAFRALLGHIRETALAAYAHQDLPFERLVEELVPERDLSRSPLFQVLFVLQNAPAEALELPGLSFELLAAHGGTAKFDLTLTLVEVDDALVGQLEYAVDLFDATTVRRLAAHLETLLVEVAADPERRLSELPLLSAAEAAQLITEWNDTASAYPRQTVDALFREMAAGAPARVALATVDEQWSYGALAAAAGAVALRLRSLGAGPEALVGVALERSPELVAAILAVLASGAAYVPLDPTYPAERLAWMLADTAPAALLSRSGPPVAPPPEGTAILPLGELGWWAPAEAAGAGSAPPATFPDSLAYLMYTSGSTGRPKGVAVPHRAIVRLVRETGYARFGPGEVFLQLAPASFDASTLEIWGALLHGGRLALLPGRTPDLGELAAALGRHRVTTLWLTAGLFHQMVEEHLSDLGGVRQLLAGGDVLSPPHVDRVRAELPDTTLINGYGPTENTTFSCCHPLCGHSLSGHGDESRPVPIGRPIAASRAYVLDRRGRPLPLAVPGELAVAGDGLARGYFGHPALTAERFVPATVGEEPGSRLYRTGDLVRFRHGGELEFLGRLDAQVKIRGFRIEPEEVEAVLHAEVGVAEAVVLVRDDLPGGRALVAYLVLEEAAGDGRPPSAEEIRVRVGRRLPEFMIPSFVVPVPELPLTPNGKVDRRALPAPERVQEGSQPVAPRSAAEEILAGLFAEVLGVERVGLGQDFFQLGGHSLLAARLASRVRRLFGRELPLSAYFEAPTVEALARRLEAAEREGPAGAELPPLEPVPRRESMPPSFAQERLWFLDRLDPGSAAYNLPTAVRLRGRLELRALAAGLRRIVERHEALRTSFRTVEGSPQQVIAAAPRFALPLLDLSRLAAEDRDETAEKLAAAEAGRSFDLARGPLLRALLVRRAGDDHLFLLTVHHAVTDGWSTGLLIQELASLYGAALEDREAELPELPVQYADFAAWQRRWLTGPVLERQVAFWRDHLAGAPPALELPTDRPRPAVQTYSGATVRRTLKPELAAALRALGRREGATLFMTLLAAFKVLLARWSGQRELVVGFPIAGRAQPELERLVGLFLNTLVLRTDLSGDPPFRQLLDRVRRGALAAFSHQDVPFERLLEELSPRRDLSRTPLFQVFFNMLSFPGQGVRLPGLEVEAAGQIEVPSKFDLTLYAADREEEISFNLVYNADLFLRERMEELLAQYELLLERFAADPEAGVTAVPLLTPRARGVLPDPEASLVAALAGAEPPVAWLGTIHEPIFRRAGEVPEATAVVDEAESWSYGELAAAAARLARELAAAGVGPGDVVALYARRSARLAPAVLGVLGAGAAFTLLDPAYPASRLAAAVRLARPRGWLAMAGEPAPEELQRAFDGLPGGCRPFPAPERQAEAAGREPTGQAALPEVEVTPESPAYVAFTSGTTGEPKGIVGGHGPVRHFLGWHVGTFGLTTADRFSLLSGLAHDPLLRDLFTPLTLGATLVIPDLDQLAAPGWLAAWMSRRRVTVAHLTPAMGELLVGGEGARGDGTAAEPVLVELRYLFFGGDRLSRSLARRLRRRAPGAALVNFYGATETPQAMAWHRLGEAEEGAVVPVGRGIDGVQLLVLTAAGEPAGLGEVGEVAVRTPYLAQGYLDDPELTRRRFVPNPWTGRPDDRLYLTGDLGRYRLDGEVELVGRKDQQLQVRGYRVEPAGIEAVLGRHPGVAAAAVIPRPDAAGETGLVAFWVPAEVEAAPAAGELRRFLGRELPEYMVPGRFVPLEALPLTPNRKLDRAALARLPLPAAMPAEEGAPRTPAEELVAGVFAQVLGRKGLGVEDDFFALGGHSLLATRVLARLQDAFAVELPVRTLFESPTVAALARRLEELARSRRGLVPPPVEPVPREPPPPLSFAQQRLWFLDRLDSGSPAYNLPTAVRLEGELEVAALAAGLAGVVERHEALRTTFPAVAGEPVQRVQAPCGVPLPVVDLTAVAAARSDGALVALAAAEAARPFDLQRGPLLRARLLRLGARDHLLLLTLHHVVTDGWSMGLLIRELAAGYRAHRAGEAPELPPLPVQYPDFAVWQRRWLSGEVLEAQLAYWRRELAGVPPLELLPDRPRPPVQSLAGAVLPFRLPDELAADLAALSRRLGATLFMTLLAAFDALLARHTGQEDLSVGTPVAGRSRPELEGLIGFFVNTLVLRADLAGDPSFADLVERVRERALAAYGHQDVPFERLVEELAPERDLARTPFFQVMFALQHLPLAGDELPGLAARPLEVDAGTARFELLLSMVEAGGLGGRLEYNTDLFDATTVRRLLGQLQSLLAAAVAEPERRLSRLPLLAPAEAHQLLREWSDVPSDGPVAGGLDDLFAAQAGATPEAVALVVGESQLSYRELARRAGVLARRLAASGVGPEERVGVLMERGEALVVALLAVLEAGGAYVPLDPAYPEERVTLMLEDAGVAALLTEEGRAGLPVAAGGPPVVAVGNGGQLPGAEAEAGDGASPTPALPGNLAYVIYTSGSTGRPKGVAIEHASAVTLVAWARRAFGPERLAGVLASTSVCFDLSVFELFVPLSAGGTVILARDALALPGLPAASRVTLVNTVPSAMAELLRLAAVPPSVSTVSLAGEPLEGRLVEALYRLPGVAEVWNLYGPSEDTTYSTGVRVPREQAVMPTIGRPVAGSRARLVDRTLGPVPPGAPGELVLAGEGLARGYLGRPALTAERWLPAPWSDEAGGRLYRTGDLARHRPDGELAFLGRIDHQVKIRGFRIELGEVTAVLVGHPGVEEAVAVARGRGGDARLVAYYAPPAGGADPGGAELRGFLAERLPGYMVPQLFVRLDALPRTPNGKVDRRALPAPEADRPSRPGTLAPRNPLELALARIFEEVLGITGVEVDESFFELGGHSLAAVRLAARIEGELGRALPLAELFRRPTVAGLAAALEQRSDEPPVPTVRLPLQPRGSQPPLFCVHPAGGSALCFLPLVRHLDRERPVWGLQHPGLEAGGAPPGAGLDGPVEDAPVEDSRVEEMAARYAGEVEAVQPAGPLHLLGWSFGGLLAYEMARHLVQRGREVALVALVDTAAPAARPAREEPDRDEALDEPDYDDDGLWLADVVTFVEGLWGRELGLGYDDLSPLPADERLERVAGALTEAGFLPAGAGLEPVRRLLAVYKANVRASRAYRGGRYHGPVALLRAQAGAGGDEPGAGARRRDPALGWEAWVDGPLTVEVVPGDHHTVLAEANAAAVAEVLEALLAGVATAAAVER